MILNNLDFSYNSYRLLLKALLEQGYQYSLIGEPESQQKSLYLRHDVDIDHLGVLPLGELEHSLGVRSTWYFLPDCPTYNLCSSELRKIVFNLHEKGHRIGLHVDASGYDSLQEMVDAINSQYSFFSSFLPISRTLSFHRPAPWLLDDISVPDWTNAYQRAYYSDVAYVSDSNRREFWKEDRLHMALSEGKSLTVLTHPLWWKEQSLLPDSLFHRSCQSLGYDRIASCIGETSKLYGAKAKDLEGEEC